LWEAYFDKIEGWSEWSEEDLRKLIENWAEENNAWYHKVELEAHYRDKKKLQQKSIQTPE